MKTLTFSLGAFLGLSSAAMFSALAVPPAYPMQQMLCVTMALCTLVGVGLMHAAVQS